MGTRAFRFRMAGVLLLLVAPLLGVLGRAAVLQVGSGGRMRDLAEDQYLSDVTLTAPRGSIVDRTGRALAVSVRVPSVFAEPRHVQDAALAARALAPVLKLPAAQLQKKLEGGRAFAWLARRVSPDVAEKVRRLELDGIGTTDESRRFYPNREMAAHVLGYTNMDGEGLEGLEKTWEERLAGKKLQVDAFRDARGGRLLLGDLAPAEMLVGDELSLTLDAQIQFITEQALARAVTQHGAAGGFAIVMEPATGAVLALANQPTFNPNDVAKATPNHRRNRAIVDAFEPGSTMKVMLLATALDAGITTLSEKIDCENGVYHLGRHRIRDTHKAGLLTVAEVLSHSSNIGALKLGTRLGRQRWGDALKRFGYGRRTGLGLTGETGGIMAPSERWSEAALATISFGQGISVSGIQLAVATAAVANKGVLLQPRIVDRVRSADGRNETVFPPHVVGTVVSERAARLTLDAMEKVAMPDGTAPLAAVPGVIVAGKTGTAQKVDPGTRGYGAGRIASFVGVAPSRDPRLVILVVVDEPQDSPYGGVVAAPVFREIAMGALPLVGVSIDNSVPAPAEVARPVPAAPSDETLASARALAQRLRADDPVDGIDEAVEPVAVDGLVPDFGGMTARAAVREALKAGLEPALAGSGVVVSQQPRPGAALRGERTVRLTLATRAGDG